MTALNPNYFPHYTYDDYAHWEGRWELISGLPYAMSPAPTINHQRINSKIVAQLSNLLDTCRNCEAMIYVDYKIAEDTVLQPDALIICQPFEDDAFITKAPAMVFEILSPSTRQKDLHLKFEIYEREGVGFYVIIDPLKKTAHIYRLIDKKYTLELSTSDGECDFEIDPCRFTFDFAKIW